MRWEMAAQDRELIVIIDSWNESEGIGTFTEQQIADFLGSCRQSINSRLVKLERWGVIHRDRSAGLNKPAAYSINRDSIPEDWIHILRLVYEFA